VRITVDELIDMMLGLERIGCHNINFVTPTHVTPMLADAVVRARTAGLQTPIVYNCGGYESVEVLKELDGLIDIYMPDIKYGSNKVGGRLSGAPDYWDVVQEAVREMHRQVGDLDIDVEGVARRGLLVRHLVMPEGFADTAEVCKFLATEISLDTYTNIMAQYRPTHRSSEVPDIARPITRTEFKAACSIARDAGLHRGF
jgi:putative pyruvate formate lyase activating enzyme